MYRCWHCNQDVPDVPGQIVWYPTQATGAAYHPTCLEAMLRGRLPSRLHECR
jgi:hypothetical protein